MPIEKMRNFGKFLRVYIALLIASIALISLTGCDKVPWSNPTSETTVIDSVSVADQIAAIENPKFMNVQDVLDFRLRCEEQYSIDSVFEALPEQVVINATTVVINRKGYADKKSIVGEYRANKTVYDNLPTKPITQSATTTKDVDLKATDLGNRRNETDVFSTSYDYRYDTINGKPVKVQIKKEESYVRE